MQYGIKLCRIVSPVVCEGTYGSFPPVRTTIAQILSLAFGFYHLQKCLRTVPDPAPAAGPLGRSAPDVYLMLTWLPTPALVLCWVGLRCFLQRMRKMTGLLQGAELWLGAGGGPEALPAVVLSSFPPDPKPPCTSHQSSAHPKLSSCPSIH